MNIGVAHQRVAAITTNLYSKGDHIESVTRNQVWSDYLADNFQEEKYQAKQMAFQQKNAKLNKAIEHKSQKLYQEDKKVVKEEKKKEKSKIEVIYLLQLFLFSHNVVAYFYIMHLGCKDS